MNSRQRWPASVIALIFAVFVLLTACSGYLITQIQAAPRFAAHNLGTPVIPTKLPLPAWVNEATALTGRLVTSNPDALEPVDHLEAKLHNSAIPISPMQRGVALPYVLPSSDVRSVTAAANCLAAAVYYEAASEPLIGQRAVAQVVLNRVRHPAFPANVCGVVFQGWERATGCQFSFTCDGSLARRPSRQGWQTALTVAQAALSGYVEPSVGLATHYHTDWVFPYWSPTLVKVNHIGAHVFLRLAGAMGAPSAFHQAHVGIENYPAKDLVGTGSTIPVATDELANNQQAAAGWIETRPYYLPLRSGPNRVDEQLPTTAISLENRAILPGALASGGSQ